MPYIGLSLKQSPAQDKNDIIVQGYAMQKEQQNRALLIWYGISKLCWEKEIMLHNRNRLYGQKIVISQIGAEQT